MSSAEESLVESVMEMEELIDECMLSITGGIYKDDEQLVDVCHQTMLLIAMGALTKVPRCPTIFILKQGLKNRMAGFFHSKSTSELAEMIHDESISVIVKRFIQTALWTAYMFESEDFETTNNKIRGDCTIIIDHSLELLNLTITDDQETIDMCFHLMMTIGRKALNGLCDEQNHQLMIQRGFAIRMEHFFHSKPHDEIISMIRDFSIAKIITRFIELEMWFGNVYNNTKDYSVSVSKPTVKRSLDVVSPKVRSKSGDSRTYKKNRIQRTLSF
jgi:hypothetical protein